MGTTKGLLRKCLSLVTWFLVASVALAGCGAPKSTGENPPAGDGGTKTEAPAATGPQRGGTLRVVETPPGGPFGVPSKIVGVAIVAAVPALETLLFVDKEGKVLPKLAETWDVDVDKATVVLHLRKGVKFHDGTDFNAEAVKFNLGQQMEAKRIPMFKSVEVIDSHTAKIQMNEWDNRVWLTLGGSTSVQASPTAIAKMGDDALTHPVGTGPFEFVSYERDTVVKYKKFDGYWDEGKPYLDALEIHFIADVQTQKAALLAGQIDVVGVGSAELASELKAQGYTAMSGNSGLTVLWPSSTVTDSPLSNLKVRQAIAWSIDREAIVKALGFGLTNPENQIAYPGQPAYFDNFQGPGFDQAKAKALLAEAGYPNGFKTSLIAPPHVTKDLLVAIQGFLTQVGIEAVIETPDQARYREFQHKGWNGLIVQPLGFFGNYNHIMGFYFWGAEEFISVKRPSNLQQLFDTSRMTVDEDKVKEQAMHKALLDDQTLIPIFRSNRTYISQKNVNGTTHMQWASWPWWTPAGAWLSTAK